jgi:hypothetical protein
MNPLRAYRFKNCKPFTIPLDNCARSFTSLCCSNNLWCWAEPHCKAGLVKIPDIVFLNTVFLDGRLYRLEPVLNNPWVLLLCTLICDPSIISCTQLIMAVDKFVGPVDAKFCSWVPCTLTKQSMYVPIHVGTLVELESLAYLYLAAA